MKKVLVIAVHPDDETLGCGGTLLRHKNQGDEIYWLIVTNISIDHGFDEEWVDRRQKEINKVSDLFGFTKTFNLNFPTTKLDALSHGDLVNAFSGIFLEVKPEVIYFPNRSDIHSDHRIVFQAAYSCTKTFRYPFVKRVLMMETLSETEFAPALPENAFNPNVFVDISEFLESKITIMEVFASEMMISPQPRSVEVIKALAAYRGSTISVKYAEAFMLLKEIV